MTSHRINGARVKAAARTHAHKQLRHFGLSFPEGAGSTTFKGSTAFATWNADTYGSLSGFRINYPALPDNAMLSRREADLIAAYTLHELGHVAFTDNHQVRGEKAVVFKLWNGIEDARIEHAVIVSGNARGARSMFKKLMSKYTTTHLSESFNPCSINSAPFALALVCRAAYGDGNGFAKSLLDRIPEPYRALYQAVADAMPGLPLDRSGTHPALNLARQFLDGWLRINPDALYQPPMPAQPEPPESDSGDGEQLSADDDVEDSDDDSDDESDLFGDQSDDSDDEESDDYIEDDFGAEPGDFWDEDSQDDDGLGDVSRDELEQDAADAAESAPEVEDNLFDGADEPDDDSDDQGGAGGGSFEPVENDQFNEEQCLAPEPNVDDVFKNARQRTKAPIDLPESSPPARSHMSKWRNLADKDETSIRRSLKRLQKSTLPALKAQLYRILKAPEVCGWDGGALGGRFDGKRAPRMLAGSEQVFKRRWLSEGINTAVSIVIDMSGSMSGSSISAAVDLAFTVADACEGARADVEVVGFKSNEYYGTLPPTYGIDGGYLRDPSYRSTANLIVAKSFNQKLAKVAHHFGYLKKITGGGTPDYTAVKGVCEQLSQLPHERKVVIVITDGIGESSNTSWDEQRGRYVSEYHMRKLSDASQQLYGCDVVGFGIYCNPQQFAEAYPIGAPVNLHNLHKSTLKGVIKQLESRDTRRVA